MQKNLKSLYCYIGSFLIISSGIATANIDIASAEDINVQPVHTEIMAHKRGTFSEESVYVVIANRLFECKEYITEKDDSLSSISRKACNELYGLSGNEFVYEGKKQYTTVFWPAIAFINNKKTTTIKNGERILCPVAEEDARTILEIAKSSGFTGKFIKDNHVYQGSNKRYKTVREIIAEICRDCYGMPVTEEFIERYAATQKKYCDPKYGKYFDLDREVRTNDEHWILGEWLPSLKEMGYNVKQK